MLVNTSAHLLFGSDCLMRKLSNGQEVSLALALDTIFTTSQPLYVRPKCVNAVNTPRSQAEQDPSRGQLHHRSIFQDEWRVSQQK